MIFLGFPGPQALPVISERANTPAHSRLISAWEAATQSRQPPAMPTTLCRQDRDHPSNCTAVGLAVAAAFLWTSYIWMQHGSQPPSKDQRPKEQRQNQPCRTSSREERGGQNLIWPGESLGLKDFVSKIAHRTTSPRPGVTGTPVLSGLECSS